MAIGADHREIAFDRHSASEKNVLLGGHQVRVQHPVVRSHFLVDVGVVDGRAHDEEMAGDVHTVPEALEHFSFGGVFDRQGRGDGGDQ